MDPTIASTLTTGLSGMVTDSMEIAMALIPTVLNLVGVMFVVKWGIKFFRTTTSKA